MNPAPCDSVPGRRPACRATRRGDDVSVPDAGQSGVGGSGDGDCWTRVCPLAEIPPLGARVWRAADGDIAVFRAGDDQVFAVRDRCPHRGGPLSQGIVFGHSVACPLHGWVIDLACGEAQAPDIGRVGRRAVRVVDGVVWIAASDHG